jgi:hypothetical protein
MGSYVTYACQPRDDRSSPALTEFDSPKLLIPAAAHGMPLTILPAVAVSVDEILALAKIAHFARPEPAVLGLNARTSPIRLPVREGFVFLPAAAHRMPLTILPAVAVSVDEILALAKIAHFARPGPAVLGLNARTSPIRLPVREGFVFSTCLVLFDGPSWRQQRLRT